MDGLELANCPHAVITFLIDEIQRLVRRLIESDDIEEVRRLRQELNGVIRERMDDIRKRAAELSKRDVQTKKQRA